MENVFALVQFNNHVLSSLWVFPDGMVGKEFACSAGDTAWSLGWKDPLGEGMAAHSSIVAWEIPWTEEPGGLQSMGCKESDMTERAHARTLTHTCSLYTQFNITVPLLWVRESFKHSGRTSLRLTVAVAFLCHILCFSGNISPSLLHYIKRVQSDHRKLGKQIICISIV